MAIFDIDSDSDSEYSSVYPQRRQTYTREELLNLNKNHIYVTADQDLASNIMRTNRDMAEIILPNFQIRETHEEEELEDIEEEGVKDKLEIMSNIADLVLNDQIILIVSLLKVSPKKVGMLESIVEVLKETLSRDFPNCKAYPYGSTSGGFAFEDCDLDVFIDLGLCSLDNITAVSRTDQQERTKLMAQILSREYRFRSAIPIVNARVPIVKLQDRKTGIHCDINCSCGIGMKNSEFIKFCRLFDVRVDQLVSFVKLLAINYDIIGRGPGDHLSSYTVVLMVLFFLQHQNILPSVEVLQSNIDEDICFGWNFAIDKEYVMESSNTSNVLTLLVDFFSFYINFPYKTHTVCPLLGRLVKKYNLKYSYSLPDVLSNSPSFGRQTDKLELNKCLVVQDPFELSRNVSSSVSEYSVGK